MEKYSLRLVMDYITGEDIIDYDVFELEDDIDFMTMVIKISNDKNMYLMCGDKLKHNFKFIRYLIVKFHDDIDFITKVGKEYITLADETEKVEMKILLCKYLNDFNSSEYMKYKINLELFYISQKFMCQTYIEKYKDEYYNKVNSLGFDIIMDDYANSDLIMEYFAQKMLDEIFNFSYFELEKKLHMKFKNKKTLINMGITNYLINYIYGYDEFLAGYVSIHTDLLDELNTKIAKMLNNWDKCELDMSRDMIEIIIEEIDKFVNENMFFLGNELEIFKYIITKFEMKELFLKSKMSLRCFDLDFSGNLDDVLDFDVNKLTLEFYGKFIKFMQMIKVVCETGMVPDNYIEERIKPKKKRGKLLKLENKNSN